MGLVWDRSLRSPLPVSAVDWNKKKKIEHGVLVVLLTACQRESDFVVITMIMVV